MSWYKGTWSLAMSENTIQIAMADNEGEAVERLTAWVLENKPAVDNPYDFEVEQVSDEVINLIMAIMWHEPYDPHNSGIKVYRKVINPKGRRKLLRKYKRERKAHKKALRGELWGRSKARHSIEELDEIIQLLTKLKEV